MTTYNPLSAKTSLTDIMGGFGDFMQQMQLMKLIKQMFPEQQQQGMPETPLPQGRMLPTGQMRTGTSQQQSQQFNPLEILGQAPGQFGQGQQFGGGLGGDGLDVGTMFGLISQMYPMLGGEKQEELKRNPEYSQFLHGTGINPGGEEKAGQEYLEAVRSNPNLGKIVWGRLSDPNVWKQYLSDAARWAPFGIAFGGSANLGKLAMAIKAALARRGGR